MLVAVSFMQSRRVFPKSWPRLPPDCHSKPSPLSTVTVLSTCSKPRIIHGDLSTDSVFLNSPGPRPAIRLHGVFTMEAAMARARRSRARQDPHQDPKAQVMGRLKPSDDIYSLGIVLLQLISGLEVRRQAFLFCASVRGFQRPAPRILCFGWCDQTPSSLGLRVRPAPIHRTAVLYARCRVPQSRG